MQGGEYIQALRQSTGAKIKIANTMPGCDERAVHITSPDRYQWVDVGPSIYFVFRASYQLIDSVSVVACKCGSSYCFAS